MRALLVSLVLITPALAAPPNPVPATLELAEAARQGSALVTGRSSARYEVALRLRRYRGSCGVLLEAYLWRAVKTDVSSLIQATAVEALAEIAGRRVVPGLLAELRARPRARVRVAILRVLRRWPGPSVVPAVVGSLGSSSADVRRAALDAVFGLGRLGRLAAPQLERLITRPRLRSARRGVAVGVVDSRERRRAAEALGRVGALDAIERLLRGDAERRSLGCLAVLSLRPTRRAAPLVPALARLVGTQPGAASALAALGPDARRALDALVRGLNHRDPQIRADCCLALGRLGVPLARAVHTRLAQLLGSDSAPVVRAHAADALGRLLPQPSRTERSLLRHVLRRDADAAVRRQCLSALGRTGRIDAPLLAALRAVIAADPDPGLRRAAVRLLDTKGGRSEAVAAALFEGVGDDSLRVRLAVGRALRKWD